MKIASASICDYNTERQDLKQAWGDWLSSLSSWDWFVTMTFKPVLPRYCEYQEHTGKLYQGKTIKVLDKPGWDRPGWASAKSAFRGFVEAARPPLGDLAYVRMFEIQKDRGVPHIHALVGRTDPSVRRMDMVDWAYHRWGITRVEQYDERKGARFYLCKYISKDIADIEFSPGLDKAVTACYSRGQNETEMSC